MVFTTDQIVDALCPHSINPVNLVQRQITELRHVLGEDHRHPQFIQTVEGGYKFIAPVAVEGDLGRIDGLLKWSPQLLYKRLDALKRDKQTSEDLRVVSTGLVPSRQDMDYEHYLGLGIRIRVVLIDPDNKPLLEARYGLRQDNYTTEDAQNDLREQIDYLKNLMSRYPSDALQVHLAKTVPCGLTVHTPQWAFFGIFPAQGSYILGPMIDAPCGSSLWNTLYDDWKIRWDNPARIVTPSDARPIRKA